MMDYLFSYVRMHILNLFVYDRSIAIAVKISYQNSALGSLLTKAKIRTILKNGNTFLCFLLF